MTNMKAKKLPNGRDEEIRIALQIEVNRAHGRSLLEGISEYAIDHRNWRLSLIDADEILHKGTLAKYDAFIVRIMDKRTANIFTAAGKPIVDVYGRTEKSPFTTIHLDDEAIGQMAAEYFVGRYFTQCAYCGFGGVRFSKARGEAFARHCAKHNLTCFDYAQAPHGGTIKDTFFRNERIDNDQDPAALRAWVESLPKPIGIFCSNDLRAVQLLMALDKSEVVVGRDVAVLGVDNDTVLCMTANPTLSSIDTGANALGRRAAQLLDEDLAGTLAGRHVLHGPLRVVERQSTNVWPFITPWLGNALSFIQDRLANGVTAAEVVKYVGYSHPVVNRAFKKETGYTIKQEIARQRLERGARLLRSTDKTTAEISDLCGFATVQYFTSSFTEKFGISPNIWRQQQNS